MDGHRLTHIQLPWLWKRPLFLWTLSFILGITLVLFTDAGQLNSVLLVGIGFLGLVITSLTRFGYKAYIVGLLLTGISVGCLLAQNSARVAPDDVSHYADYNQHVAVDGTVTSDTQSLNGRVSFIVCAETLESGRSRRPVSGSISVSLPLANATRSTVIPEYGDDVSIAGHLTIPADQTNPGGFSWKRYLANRGIHSELTVRTITDVAYRGHESGNPMLRFCWLVQHNCLTALRRGLPRTVAPIVSAIALGQSGLVPSKTKQLFSDTGTIHILASGGLHVAILAFCLLGITRLLTLPRKLAVLLTILLLWVYAIAAGARPAVVRAVVTATVYLGAVIIEREPDLLTALSIAVLLVLSNEPGSIEEPGFQMSFLAVLCLVSAMPLWDRVADAIRRRVRQPTMGRAAVYVVEIIGVSLIAQLGAAPIVLESTNIVSVDAILANLCIVPLLAVIVPGALLASALWYVTPALAVPIFWVVGLAARWVLGAAQFWSNVPGGHVVHTAPSPAIIVVYYALFFGLCAGARKLVRA